MLDDRFKLLQRLVLGLKAHIYHLEYANAKRVSIDKYGNNIKFTFIVNDQSNNFHDSLSERNPSPYGISIHHSQMTRHQPALTTEQSNYDHSNYLSQYHSEQRRHKK